MWDRSGRDNGTAQVCRADPCCCCCDLSQSNWLKAQGVRKGDAVAIYMPMVVELPVAMLACARIGAVHNVVFGGFSADALAARVVDSK